MLVNDASLQSPYQAERTAEQTRRVVGRGNHQDAFKNMLVMTAQKKAKEIFDKAKYLSHYEGATPWEISYLIVDEVLDVVNGIYDYDAEVLIPYWEDVKKELDSLK